MVNEDAFWPKVSGRSRRVAADQGWSLRGVPLYIEFHVVDESVGWLLQVSPSLFASVPYSLGNHEHLLLIVC